MPDEVSMFYKCDACFDRGFYIFYRNGNRVSLGERHEIPCPHCTGNWSYDTKQVDKELQDALAWFRKSTPPAAGFRLNKWKMIDDPAEYWKYLKSEIALDNIYILERHREDLMQIQALFDGEEM